MFFCFCSGRKPNLDDSLTTSIIQLSQYISRDVINACVDEEINKRNKEKTRSNNALQTNQQLQQEKLLSKLAEDEKRNREKEYSKSLKLKSTKSIEKRLKLMAKEKAKEIENEKQLRQQLDNERRHQLQLKRAELDKTQQENRLKQLELTRKKNEELVQEEEQRKKANQASYELWKEQKKADKEKLKRQKINRAQRAHEENVRLLAQLHKKLKSQVINSNGKAVPAAVSSSSRTTTIDTDRELYAPLNINHQTQPKIPTPPSNDNNTSRFTRGSKVKKRTTVDDIDKQMIDFFGNNKNKSGHIYKKQRRKMKKENTVNATSHSFDFNSMATISKV